MNTIPAVSQRVVDAFREQDVGDLFGFFFIGTARPDTLVMNWAYGDGANWTQQTGVALLERVIEAAQAALEIARNEQATK